MITTDIEPILEDIDEAYGQVAVSVFRLCNMGKEETAAKELIVFIDLLRSDLDRIQNNINRK